MIPKTVYLALGSNVGDREQNLARALEGLQQAGVRVNVRSSIYETEPQDVLEQPWFLNMAVECETELFPLRLLSVSQEIERSLGRQRRVRSGPRTIDIDVLLIGEALMETQELTIPHPRMNERRFVLEPLVEIAPELRDPKTGERFAELLRTVGGQRVRRL